MSPAFQAALKRGAEAALWSGLATAAILLPSLQSTLIQNGSLNWHAAAPVAEVGIITGIFKAAAQFIEVVRESVAPPSSGNVTSA